MKYKNGIDKRKSRVRYQLKKKAGSRNRLSVFRSGKHIYAQIIDDQKGVTVVSASTVEKATSNDFKKTADKDAAFKVGQIVAEKAIKNGVKEVVFDRGSYLYHGRVKALAEGARDKGLAF
jgi:large subunit ribosomal protein L18